MSIRVSYKPPKYTKEEILAFRKFRKKVGPDYGFYQNRREFKAKDRMMRKTLVGLSLADGLDIIFLLFEVEYGWYSKPQSENGEIQITTAKLVEVNEAEPTTKEIELYSLCYLNNDSFNKNLIEADYYKYEPRQPLKTF